MKIYRLQSNRPSQHNGYYGYKELYSSNVYVRRGYHTNITINYFGKVFIDEQEIKDHYYHGHNKRDNNHTWNGSNNHWIDEASFRQFKTTLSNEPFENARLTIANQIVSNNYFSSSQVKELVQVFVFENNKLEFAKSAYSRTVDKNNYYIINDAFHFSSTKEQLTRFIESN